MAETTRGLWIAVEGADGAGKTTALHYVAELLKAGWPDLEIISTKHPGATPLGRHLRSLIKNPTQYDVSEIDDLSAQLLMMADHINFTKSVLEPALERGALVLADRCDLLSCLVYGLACGLRSQQINALVGLAAGIQLDRLYVLQCGREFRLNRLDSRDNKSDKFEAKGSQFQDTVANLYDNIVAGDQDLLMLSNRIVPFDRIKPIDANKNRAQIANAIADDIRKLWRSQSQHK